MAPDARGALCALALAWLVLRASASAFGTKGESEAFTHRRHLTQACPACDMQLGTCFQDASCAQYLGCINDCAPTNGTCLNPCTFRFEANPAVRDANACMQSNGCLGPSVMCTCPAPKKTGTKLTQANLGELRGTYDIVYGFGTLDCLDYQELNFYPSKHKGRGVPSRFRATQYVTLPNDGLTAAFNMTWVRNTTTGAYLVSYTVTGLTYRAIAYSLYGGEQHVLVVQCHDLGTACFPGGFLLSKRKPGAKAAVYPSSSTVKKFKAALSKSGWAARYNAGFDQWCRLKAVL